MKKLFLQSTLFISTALCSQVGINTSNPSAALDIVSKGSTSLTKALGISNSIGTQITTVLDNGNVGIGTSLPSTRLEISNGTTNGAIKIVDGTEGADKVLMSDAQGLGTWRTPASIKPTVIGIAGTNYTITSNTNGGTQYSGFYLDLPQGKWLVNGGLTIYNTAPNSRYWIHFYLSSSFSARETTDFALLGTAGNNTGYAGVMTNNSGAIGTDDQELNFINGSSLINVTAPSVRIYLLIENRNSWKYGTGAYENYFYAIPIN